jgi:hypothetical protein
MSKRWIKAASTSQTIDIFVLDSSSTVGAGLTGLVFNTAGLTCYYRKGALGTPTAITLATLATVGTAWSSGGFIAVDGTNMPGVYRLDIPNVVLDTAGMVTMYLRGATNMAPVVLEIEVVSVDIYDTVRFGLTSIPNVAQGTTGAISTGNATGQVTVATNNDKTGYSLTTAPLTTAQTASAVWDALLASYTTANSFGARIIRGTSTSPSYETFITGSNHIASDVHQMQSSVITAAAIAANAITSAKLDATALAAIADYILLRKLDRTGQGTGSTSNERTVLSALRYLRNKVDISASTMTITTEDDTTTAWTATLSSTAGLNPVTGVDPA